MGSALPPREANQFKLIVKAYETKQYKKGVKAADAVLKKFPEHGETLAMKGLVLNCMDKKAEAYDLVRRGLKNDLKSHVCWHVYGLLYRSDRKYRDAIKCYLNALRIDPQNQQILKDLSLLQVQMRDRTGFVESRRTLLTLRPNQRNNWLAFAVAQHLNHSYDTALQILQAYEGTIEEDSPPDNERYEHSEMVLYKVRVMVDAGKLEDALLELHKQEAKIVDKLGVREQRAALLLRLGRPAEARRQYEDLVEINPDNYKYFEGLQACLGLKPTPDRVFSDGQVVELKALFEKLEKKHPRSSAVRRMPLDFLSGDEFAEAAERYIWKFLKKGVPSLFSDLDPLYNWPTKANILDSVLSNIENSLRSSNTRPDASLPNGQTPSRSEAPSTVTSVLLNGLANGVEAHDEEADSVAATTASGVPNGVAASKDEDSSPACLLWYLFFSAQHYNKRGRVEDALAAINEAIAHTPTVQDLYLVKARILQGAGDYRAASKLADSARTMDLSDRYLNSEAVQMMLRADEVEVAEKTAALFTKHGDQHESLFDMQCMWYELASGDSYLRQKIYGKAMKNYMAVNKHYNDMIEDQFDFHTYCLRKMTLRAYVDMMDFEDRLHSFPSFCHGAQGLVQCYLDLHDAPSKQEAESSEADAGSMSVAERRKLRQKQRKMENKAKKEAEDKRKEDEDTASASVKGASGAKAASEKKGVDSDPDGLKLLEEEDKLGEAVKHLTLLLSHASLDIKTHALAFEVFSRRHKLLLSLQAVKRMHSLAPEHPSTHRCLIQFFLHVSTLPVLESEAAKLVNSVIVVERQELGLDGSLDSLKRRNSKFLDEHAGSLLHRAAAAEVEFLLDPSRKAQAVATIEQSAEPQAEGSGALAKGTGVWTHEDCVQIHHILQHSLKDDGASQRWAQRCADRFPHSEHFKGPMSSVVIGFPEDAILTNGIHDPTDSVESH